MPQSLKDALDAYAFERNLSSSDVARQAIAAFIRAEESLPTHGNTKYTTDSERAAARKRQREQAKLRAALTRRLADA